MNQTRVAPAPPVQAIARESEAKGQGTGDVIHDLLLPTLLFAALGGMTWAVRGSSGFGAVNGCLFAGVTWGAAWWFIARDHSAAQARRYSSGWIILALTVGIGISGNRGWMQWPSFFEGHLQLNSTQGKFAPVSKLYGFAWLFVAGVPWAGLGACFLAWCAPSKPVRLRDWLFRSFCGVLSAMVLRLLFDSFPELFLPLYNTLKAQYADPVAYPNLKRLINDDKAALTHLGLYLGFLSFEAIRKDWKNVILIGSVGLLNGFGWSLCQNWKWAATLWPNSHFNWWRCWESCGGISIGLAYGLAYFLVNRRDPSLAQSRIPDRSPNLERFAAFFGLILGLGLSLKNGFKGWANIYIGNEDHWNRVTWMIVGPLMAAGLVLLMFHIRSRRVSADLAADLFPHDVRTIGLVLLTQNAIAQLVTGPWTEWNEVAFNIYYLLLLGISGTIVLHFDYVKRTEARLV
ncbi:MAG TPA: hypothetical protein VKY92_01660 [Verrucomicrobiae bacterium]|nr:hypothetical protein [Verrucomicrobiae bacterium]